MGVLCTKRLKMEKDCDFEYLESNKGGKILYSNGYYYTKEKSVSTKIYWKCQNWTSFCRGRGTLVSNTFSRTADHNHEGNPVKVEVKKKMSQIKEKALASNDAPQVIVSSVMSDVSGEASTSCPSISSIRRTISHIRKKKYSHYSIPKDLEDLVIPQKYRKTGKNEEFILYDSNDKQRVIIMGTKQNLNFLERSTKWYIDGTFKTVPELFHQLLTIHGDIEGIVYPLIYCLLPNKMERTYIKIFEKVREFIKNPKVSLILMDFEIALINATNLLFPIADKQGCYFHFRQALYRRICSSGLKRKYDTDKDFNKQIKFLISLAFVPEDLVLTAFNVIEKSGILTDHTQQFCSYFKKNWMGIQDDNKKKHASFSFHLWNYFNRTLNEEPRTNNFSESWHSALKKQVQSKHPSIWKFFEFMLDQQSMQELQINQQLTGCEKSLKKKKYNDKNKRLATVVQSFARDKCTDTYLLDYLKAITLTL